MRFYFIYIFNNTNIIESIGANQFYEKYIKDSIEGFINKRFKNIVEQYFIRQCKNGKMKDVLNIGSYWYDDQKNHKNGQFDCVLQVKNGYKVYEIKRLKDKMSKKMCETEISKIKIINDLNVVDIGIVSSNGFEFNMKDVDLITGKDIYIYIYIRFRYSCNYIIIML